MIAYRVLNFQCVHTISNGSANVTGEVKRIGRGRIAQMTDSEFAAEGSAAIYGGQ
jgi:hypothetical protein